MAIKFDTLKFANRLKAAGVPSAVAEAHAEAEAEALSELTTTQLATKTDLAELKAEFKDEIHGVKAEIAVLKMDVAVLKKDVVVRLGGIMAGGVLLIAALLTYFHM